MGVFVGHEPCPQCGSRDNLGRYEDGGAWCFGCHYMEPATKYLLSAPAVPKVHAPPPRDVVSELPPINYAWLRQFLTPDEISKWFLYSAILERHLFIHNGRDGQTYWEARSVYEGPSGTFQHKNPKVVSSGEKPFICLGPWQQTKQIVLVEDIVSAIKLSRYTGSMPLFGCHIALDRINKLAGMGGVKKLVIWLDDNKYGEALKFAAQINPLKHCEVLRTTLDPKSVPEEDIKELLGVA